MDARPAILSLLSQPYRLAMPGGRGGSISRISGTMHASPVFYRYLEIYLQ
jgi:hypothetical protein